MIRHLIFAMFIGFLILLLYFGQYLGAFRSVKVGIENRGSMTLIYKEHFGPYHKIVPVINEVEAHFKELNLNCKVSFGEYLDNPRQVDENRLRSIGGCLLQNSDGDKINKLPNELFKKEIPERRYVIAIFEGSPGIGPMKVYPKVEEFMKENNLTPSGPVIETYEIHSEKAMTTTYYFPIR